MLALQVGPSCTLLAGQRGCDMPNDAGEPPALLLPAPGLTRGTLPRAEKEIPSPSISPGTAESGLCTLQPQTPAQGEGAASSCDFKGILVCLAQM